jgi:hypothetical protein
MSPPYLRPHIMPEGGGLHITENHHGDALRGWAP